MRITHAIFYGLVLALTACDDDDVGSGQLVTEDRTRLAFDAVDVANSFTVEVSRADTPRVLITADDNVIAGLVTEVVDGRLTVGLGSTSVSNATLRAQIQLPVLTELTLRNSVEAEVAGFTNLDNLRLDIATSSELDVEAVADRVDLRVATSSSLAGFGLRARVLDADLSTSATADVTVVDTLSGTVATSSALRYRGRPTVTASADVSSSIRQDD